VTTALRRCAGLLLAVAAIGAGAAPLSLPDLDGAGHTLADWRGRVVLLAFWASWCEPCIAEIPHLVALDARQRAHGLSIVGVGLDAPDKLRNVVRTLSVGYPVLVADPDDARPLLEAWGDKSGVIPYLVLIDRQGRVVATHRGPIDKDELDEFVEPHLSAANDPR
jgi:peroxiredoxin